MRVFVPTTDKDIIWKLFGEYTVDDRLMAYAIMRHNVSGYLVVRKGDIVWPDTCALDFEF